MDTIKISYNKSFEANLCLTKEEIKNYYLEILSNILMHNKTRHRLSWTNDTYYHGRNQLARIAVRSNTLYLYLALNPLDYSDSKYKLFDVSDKKKYVKTPLLIKIKGKRTFKYAFTLLNDLYELNNLVDAVDATDTDMLHERYLTRPLEDLVNLGLVKKVIRAIKVDKNVKVRFWAKCLNPLYDVDTLYLSGNMEALGKWNLVDALEMKRVNDHFELELELPSEHLEFKLLEKPDWKYVEKGMWKEEIVNHHYDLVNDQEIEDLIFNFRHR